MNFFGRHSKPGKEKKKKKKDSYASRYQDDIIQCKRLTLYFSSVGAVSWILY